MKIRASVSLWLVGLAVLALFAGAASEAGAVLRLKASHQFAEGDIRDQMIRVFGERVAKKLKGEVSIRVYPSQSLYKAVEQWDAMKMGGLDMSLYPFDYASGKVPQFSITLMPCSVTSLKQAQSWQNKEIGKRMDKLCEANGIKVLIWSWLPGGIASTKKMIKVPDDVKGQVMRAAGKQFEFMLKEAGASISSMPSSEIYHALSTGVLDACLTSTASFVSYRLYEQVKYINIPKDYAIWYMGEPVLMSLKTWKRLSPAQKKAFEEVADDMSDNWAVPNMATTTQSMIDAFTKAKVNVHYMTKDEFGQWLALAKKTAWTHFAKTVPGGQELLDLALKAMD